MHKTLQNSRATDPPKNKTYMCVYENAHDDHVSLRLVLGEGHMTWISRFILADVKRQILR